MMSLERLFLSLLGLFISHINVAPANPIDAKHIHFDEIDSTQFYAIEYGNELIKDRGQWAVISADK